MQTYNVHEAKTRLSELLQRVEQGEEFILARGGKPIAKLSRFTHQSRRPGYLGKEFRLDSEMFARADSEIENLFECSELLPE